MGEHPWSADIDLGESDIADILARRFPDLADAPVRSFGEGWDFRVFEVADRLLFRLPKRKDETDRLRAEGAFLWVLGRRLSIRVPSPTYAGDPGDDFPWAFAGHARIDGVAARDLDLDDRDRARLARDIGSALRIVHSVRPDEVDPPLHRWAPDAALNEIRDEATRCLAAIGDRVESPLLASLRSRGELPPPFSGKLVPVHGDLGPEHVFLEPASRHLTGIIDWSDCCLSDPALEFGPLSTFLPPEPLARAVVAAGYDPDPAFLARVRESGFAAALGMVRYGIDGWRREYVEEGLHALGWILDWSSAP